MVHYRKRKLTISEGSTTAYVVLKELDFNKIKPLDLLATLQDILEPMKATTGKEGHYRGHCKTK